MIYVQGDKNHFLPFHDMFGTENLHDNKITRYSKTFGFWKYFQSYHTLYHSLFCQYLSQQSTVIRGPCASDQN